MTDSIKFLRIRKGLTQVELAKEVGVTFPTVSAWETGKSIPSPRHLKKLATVLDCSVEQIFLLLNTKKLDKNKRDQG